MSLHSENTHENVSRRKSGSPEHMNTVSAAQRSGRSSSPGKLHQVRSLERSESRSPPGSRTGSSSRSLSPVSGDGGWSPGQVLRTASSSKVESSRGSSSPDLDGGRGNTSAKFSLFAHAKVSSDEDAFIDDDAR